MWQAGRAKKRTGPALLLLLQSHTSCRQGYFGGPGVPTADTLCRQAHRQHRSGPRPSTCQGKQGRGHLPNSSPCTVRCPACTSTVCCPACTCTACSCLPTGTHQNTHLPTYPPTHLPTYPPTCLQPMTNYPLPVYPLRAAPTHLYLPSTVPPPTPPPTPHQPAFPHTWQNTVRLCLQTGVMSSSIRTQMGLVQVSRGGRCYGSRSHTGW